MSYNYNGWRIYKRELVICAYNPKLYVKMTKDQVESVYKIEEDYLKENGWDGKEETCNDFIRENDVKVIETNLYNTIHINKKNIFLQINKETLEAKKGKFVFKEKITLPLTEGLSMEIPKEIEVKE